MSPAPKQLVPGQRRKYEAMLRRLRQARHQAGLTQAEVAERLGWRQTVVSKIELGERRIDPVVLAVLAKLYKKPISEFVD